MKRASGFLCGGKRYTRHVGSCEHLNLPEDLLLCNPGDTSHSFPDRRYLCYESPNPLLFTISCKGRKLAGMQVEEQDPEEPMNTLSELPIIQPLHRLASSGTAHSLSQRTQILYPFQQDDKQLTENGWFLITFLSTAFLHPDQIKSNQLPYAVNLQNQQHHMYWHVFCELWRKGTCKYCVRTATRYMVCKLVCSKLLHAVKLHPWGDLCHLPIVVAPAEVLGGSSWTSSRVGDATCWGSLSGLCNSQLRTKAVSSYEADVYGMAGNNSLVWRKAA